MSPNKEEKISVFLYNNSARYHLFLTETFTKLITFKAWNKDSSNTASTAAITVYRNITTAYMKTRSPRMSPESLDSRAKASPAKW